MYQCEEQISLFHFYCHIDIPVTIFSPENFTQSHLIFSFLPGIPASLPSAFIPEIISTPCAELLLLILAIRYHWSPKTQKYWGIVIQAWDGLGVLCLVPLLVLFQNLMEVVRFAPEKRRSLYRTDMKIKETNIWIGQPFKRKDIWICKT